MDAAAFEIVLMGGFCIFVQRPIAITDRLRLGRGSSKDKLRVLILELEHGENGTHNSDENDAKRG